MEFLMELLRILLIALVLFPFIGTLGCSFISTYFTKKLDYQAKLAKATADAMKNMLKKEDILDAATGEECHF